MSRYSCDRPVFCGNFEYDANVREIERLFERYGRLDRVEMKTGMATALALANPACNKLPSLQSSGARLAVSSLLCSWLDYLVNHGSSVLLPSAHPVPTRQPKTTPALPTCTDNLITAHHLTTRDHAPVNTYLVNLASW